MNLDISLEYLYRTSLLLLAVVVLVFAVLLIVDPENDVYAEVRRYLRTRYLTAAAMLVFASGFFLQWLFMPREYSPVLASSLALEYFHIGGVLLSMGHTSLADKNYLTKKVVIRDTCGAVLGLVLYILAAILESNILLYAGFAVFFIHMGFLTNQFQAHFTSVYKMLKAYLDEHPISDSDQDMRWMVNSCYLIILFGIGSVVITLAFPENLLPYTILTAAGIAVFAYIYKAVEGFGLKVFDVEKAISSAEKINNK